MTFGFINFLKNPVGFVVKETHLKERAGATALNVGLRKAGVKTKRDYNYHDIELMKRIHSEIKKDGLL